MTRGLRFATAPLALSDVKETSKHLGVTLNDVVLATAAVGLRIRLLLLRYDGSADAPLIAGVPVSYNTSPERLDGNRLHLHDAIATGSYRRPAAAVCN